jgi:hypothetical protein
MSIGKCKGYRNPNAWGVYLLVRLHALFTPFGRLMTYKTMSMISVAYDFTTKSRGIWHFPARKFECSRGAEPVKAKPFGCNAALTEPAPLHLWFLPGRKMPGFWLPPGLYQWCSRWSRYQPLTCLQAHASSVVADLKTQQTPSARLVPTWAPCTHTCQLVG